MGTFYVVIGHLKIKLTKNDPILDRISLYGHRSAHCDPYLDRLEAIQFWIVSPQFAQLEWFGHDLQVLFANSPLTTILWDSLIEPRTSYR